METRIIDEDLETRRNVKYVYQFKQRWAKFPFCRLVSIFSEVDANAIKT